MWRSTSTQLKPGGKLVNVRATGPFDTDHVKSGKYGLAVSALTSRPGGVRYQVTVHIDPPFEFEGTTLKASANLSNEIYHRNAFGVLEVLKPEDTEVVRSDEAFWEYFQRVVLRHIDSEKAVDGWSILEHCHRKSVSAPIFTSFAYVSLRLRTHRTLISLELLLEQTACAQSCSFQ